MKRIFLVVISMISTSVWALDCREAQSESAVGRSVQQMIERPENYRSIEDFLIALPDELKSNFTFLADSRSFHASTLENPRVVMSSPDGRVRVSYNTEAGSRGSNAVEISIWDPESMSFRYKEVKLKGATGPLVSNQNPVACANCHGNPPKPNLESPDRLPGAIPYAQDTYVSRSPESQWYRNYIERIEERSPENFRLNVLRPERTLEELTQQEANSPTVVVRNSNQRQNSYEQASHLMRCFHAKRMQNRSNFDNLKYLLAGLKLGCSPASFMQDWNYQAAVNYFRGRLPNFESPQGTREQRFAQLREQIVRNTAERQEAGLRRGEGRQKAFWLQNYLDQESVETNMSQNKTLIPQQEKNLSQESSSVADMRLMLEPLGIQVSRFSLSRDPFDYNFNGEFSSDYIMDSDVEEILSENTSNIASCDFLAQRNQEALEGLRPKAEKFSLNICNQSQAVDNRINELAGSNWSVTITMIKQEAAKVLVDKCMACHQSASSSGTNIGALVIPFGDINKVEDLLTSDFGRLNELKEIMRDRINRPHGHQGAMPVSMVTDMTVDEKAYLTLWLDSIRSEE